MQKGFMHRKGLEDRNVAPKTTDPVEFAGRFRQPTGRIQVACRW
jgi:hypothetical protein